MKDKKKIMGVLIGVVLVASVIIFTIEKQTSDKIKEVTAQVDMLYEEVVDVKREVDKYTRAMALNNQLYAEMGTAGIILDKEDINEFRNIEDRLMKVKEEVDNMDREFLESNLDNEAINKFNAMCEVYNGYSGAMEYFEDSSFDLNEITEFVDTRDETDEIIDGFDKEVL